HRLNTNASHQIYTLSLHDALPIYSKDDYIKRLIGKPGDTVSYKSDNLYINGKKVQEPYLKYNKNHKYSKTLTEDFNSKDLKGSNGKKTIPKNRYLVLGDNRL